MELLRQPWPWPLTGLLIGLTVPALLLLGNKKFGISSSLRHICAMCVPANLPFFKYDWRKEAWNLYFVAGIAIGAFLANFFLRNPDPVAVSEATKTDLAAYGLTDFSELMPRQIFDWENLLTLKGFFFFIVGGFLVGFGIRYAGGCTSGHSIMGLSNLQWPSLVATMAFMAGGFLCTWLILPYLLQL